MNRNRIAVFVTLVLGLSGIVWSQSTPKSNMVYVPVTVSGPKNASVSGLKKENFILKEDGVEQTLTAFYDQDQPIDIDLILAMGALQRGRADLLSSKIRESVENFRHQSNSQNKWVVEELNFGANGIFDAISRHVTRLAQNSINPRKLVLVLTDGFESSGGNPGQQLQEYAKKLDVPIYIVYTAFRETIPGGGSGTGVTPGNALPDLADTAGRRGAIPNSSGDTLDDIARGDRIHGNAGAVYEDLTKFTGGKLYESEADTALAQFLETLASELKGQYVLGFKSTNDARNDKWRKLEVKIKAPNGVGGIKEKDMKPKARDRYFVAKAD